MKATVLEHFAFDLIKLGRVNGIRTRDLHIEKVATFPLVYYPKTMAGPRGVQPPPYASTGRRTGVMLRALDSVSQIFESQSKIGNKLLVEPFIQKINMNKRPNC